MVLIAAPIATSAAQAQTTYSGDAFAAYVNTAATGPIYVSDTGQLSPSGGSRNDALLDTGELGLATLNSVLVAEVLAASTSGASGTAESAASLANLVVLPGSAAQVTASFVRAQTKATCSGGSGSSEIADLTFGGRSIAVTGASNQTITLPGGAELIINEQTTTENGTFHQIQVNALHLIVPGVAEVILSSAESDINCTGTVTLGPCDDFVTGGGWIVTAGNSRGNFGFNAGLKAGSATPDVHLNYIDHGSGMKVKVISADGNTSDHISSAERRPSFLDVRMGAAQNNARCIVKRPTARGYSHAWVSQLRSCSLRCTCLALFRFHRPDCGRVLGGAF